MVFDRFWWYLELETLGMPPEGIPRAGEAVLCKTNVVICSFSIGPIFNLVTANDRYKNPKRVFFSFFL